MSDQSDKGITTPIKQTAMAVNIDSHMKRKKDMQGKNFDLTKIKKFPAFSFVLVTDPIDQSRVFGWVSFEGISFMFFEQSVQEIPSEKGVDIGYRMNFEQFEMQLVTQDHINSLTQDSVVGSVFSKLHVEINNFSKKRWNIELDSLLTTLNAMNVLGLMETDHQELLSLEESRALAANVSDADIKNAAWFALRMREARYIIERESLAIDAHS